METHIHRIGSTKSARYKWGPGPKGGATPQTLRLVKNLKGLFEDEVYEDVSTKLFLKKRLSRNGYRIAYYAFSEMLNNAIEHSDSDTAEIEVKVTLNEFTFTHRDFGIGIFNRIKRGFKLKDDYGAIEHLFKGKQTTMPERHSGRGIFFTSRIADRFEIRSGPLSVVIDNDKDDQMVKESRKIKGTEVYFSLRAKTKKSLQKLFEIYSDTDFEFTKNRVRVKLNASRELISRSQARKLLFGLEKFQYITFDFMDVDGIGQGFADEIFRVFPKMHADKFVEYVNANKSVSFMIRRALD